MSIKFYMNKASGIEIISIEASNEHYKSHNHTLHYVIGFMVKGEIRLEKGTKTYTLEAQDTFVIEPDQKHAIKALKSFTLIAFSIEETFFNTYPVEEAKKIVHQMKQWPKLMDLLMNVNMERILNHIEAIYRLQNTNPATHKKRELDHVKVLICDHATKPLSLDNLAESAFLSKFHFVKKFSAEFGLTPHNFKIQRQIRMAQKQLLETKSISEVAANMGFFDQSHFTKYFKKILKLTPTDYKHACIELEVLDSKPEQA
ncbi:helix-turn-helix domain-containing protein [Fusibacter sp. 3D3]|uniref:AraC family transcriptional regulator n=1 Tax=Fusibacter sp. 3D3 TaxID=1048380 RepID=UPI000852FC31|nr:helix-turn-helix domain-containing protein [Fusibacter sp. 3D3]GAU76900.1 transcriptional regulator [Fusibacter sp. 3D3]